jgi:hypothetical protein
MKIRNTTVGEIVIGTIAFPPKKSVTLNEEQIAELQTFKGNPAVEYYLETGKLSGGEDAEEEVVESEVVGSEGTRDAIVAEVIKNLDKTTGFLASGAPRVEAINSSLPEGSEPVTSEERDAIWARIQGGEI